MNKEGAKKNVVLIVDDSPETLSMLNDLLDRAGFTVLVALEGAQALTIVDNITPDIILLDAIMPNMDGFETCYKLKANRSLAHIPIIFMTGLSDSESIVKGLASGGIDYISKPVNGDELIARMWVHLENAHLTMSARKALDTAGQYLFATSFRGKILWSTPLANELFTASNINAAWLEQHLPHKLRQLLSPHFNKEKGLLLDSSLQKLEIRFVSQTGVDEYLLRLIQLERPNEIHILRTALALTKREAEVLLWLAHGKTNREIGMIISMSPRTVNKHLEQVFRKLNVENRTSAALIAHKHLQRG